MKTELYNIWKSFLTWVGDIYMATEPPLCKAKNIEEMMEVIDAGDIICRGYNYYLDSHFIPGDYTHSGIVINKREMIHSIAEGVQSIHPIDFVKDTDRFCVIRPQYSGNSVHMAIDRAIWHCEANKTEYDFTFKEDGKFYCHEFTADCLEYAGIRIPKFTKVFGVWPFKFERKLYLASSFLILPEKQMKVLYVMKEEKDGKNCR
jgi:hypothetical protein